MLQHFLAITQKSDDSIASKQYNITMGQIKTLIVTQKLNY